MFRADIVDTNAQDAARKRTLLDALYRTYGRALRKFLARKRLSLDEVSDIVQETYCRIHQSGGVERIRHPKAFLFRVANNVLINTARHRRSGPERDALDVQSMEILADEPGPYRRLNAEQELALVRAAFRELAPKCREVFVMNRFENLSYPQIASELNLSTSMIEKYMSQALAHLRKRLSDVSDGPVRGTLRALK